MEISIISKDEKYGILIKFKYEKDFKAVLDTLMSIKKIISERDFEIQNLKDQLNEI